MSDDESQGKGRGERKKKVKDERKRWYAFLVYPDSAPADWIARLAALCIEALVSPLHDADVNPDGTPKKAHWHVVLVFDGKKSVEQINSIRAEVLGEDYNPGFERIESLRGYARYLCHMDNPEKAQYDKSQVKALGGLDYDAIIALPGDDSKAIGQMFKFIVEHNVEYFSDFMLLCESSNPEWFDMLTKRKSYIVVEFIKSFSVKKARANNPYAGMAGYFNNQKTDG